MRGLCGLILAIGTVIFLFANHQVSQTAPIPQENKRLKPEFALPHEGKISSPFSLRKGRLHKGVDIRGSEGDMIHASDIGIVKFSGDRGTYGKTVIIKHKMGYHTLYAHNSKVLVKKGDLVMKHQAIAQMGSTGRSTGNHVHFEIYKGNKHFDPLMMTTRSE